MLTMRELSASDAIDEFLTTSSQRNDCTYLRNVATLTKVRELDKSIIFKLPTGHTYFHPKIMIENPNSTDSFNLCFKNDMIIEISKSKNEKGQWIKYDVQNINVPDILKIILCC